MWLYLTLISAFIYSFRSIIEKVSLKNIDKYILAFGLRLFALPLFIIPFIIKPDLFIPLSSIPLSSWLAIIFISVISSPIEIIFFYKALQLSEVTTLIPLLSLGPIITTFFNILVFKSYPSLAGLLGIVLIVVSIYILNLRRAKEGWLEPFRQLSMDRATRYLSVMLFLYSFGVVVDKYAITGTNPYVYALLTYGLNSLALFVLALKKSPTHFIQIKQNLSTFIILGLIVFIYTLPRNLALSIGNAGYISAVLSSSVILSTLIGLVYLKEKDGKVKIIASIVAFVGIVILKLFS